MIAGALPANNNALSPGAGAVVGGVRTGVTIDSNTLISNQSNDDGGGIRFLMAGDFPFDVKNNIIANNLSTHEGAGIALDDSPGGCRQHHREEHATATAATSSGGNASTGEPCWTVGGPNSSMLQAQLNPGTAQPAGSRTSCVQQRLLGQPGRCAELPTGGNQSGIRHRWLAI